MSGAEEPSEEVAGGPGVRSPLPTVLRLFGMAMMVAVGVGAIGIYYWKSEPLNKSDASAQIRSLGQGRREVREDLIEVAQAKEARRAARRAAGPMNGFDVSNATIPTGAIMGGGPGKDGIPAIMEPKFTSARKVDYLKRGDLVVGVTINGESKAYPLRVVVWHEIVNDTVGGQPVAVTYCPLCGTCMVFDREYGGREHTFGVSGLLYQSDVLMYDHQTDSLWSQLMMESVAGEMVGTALTWLPSEQMTWAAWEGAHPDGLVLTTDTGFRRSYESTAYESYMESEHTMFPVPEHRTDLRTKEWVLGVIVEGKPKAYPVSMLEGLGRGTLSDTIAGTALEITYDRGAKHARVVEAGTGTEIPHVSVYWFAWQAFYPETLVHASGD